MNIQFENITFVLLPMIYHITTPDYFALFDNNSEYEAASLASEGFIHCSTLAQLKTSASRYYSNEPEIIVLTIDEQKLISEVKYEFAKIGQEYPHIYGPINKDAIIETRKYSNKNGNYEM